MPDWVDAAVHAMQSRAGEPVIDCPPAEAQLDQLWPADDTVLSAREAGKQVVKCNRSGSSPLFARLGNRFGLCPHDP